MPAGGLPEQGCCGASVVAPSGGELFRILRGRFTIDGIRQQEFGYSGGAQGDVFGAQLGAPLPYLFETAKCPVQGARQGHEFGGVQGASAQKLVEGARVEGLVPEAQLAVVLLAGDGVEFGDSGCVPQGGGYLRGLGVSGCIRAFFESVPVGCRAQSGRGGSGALGCSNGAQGVASGARGGYRGYGSYRGCALGGSAPVLDNLQGGQGRVGDAFQNVCFFASHTIMLSNNTK